MPEDQDAALGLRGAHAAVDGRDVDQQLVVDEEYAELERRVPRDSRTFYSTLAGRLATPPNLTS